MIVISALQVDILTRWRDLMLAWLPIKGTVRALMEMMATAVPQVPSQVTAPVF
jgi:hypothetical protein